MDRNLPPPVKQALHGGERVKLKSPQVYHDGITIEAGAEGLAMHPGSQAATWVVYFPKLRSRRVVPGWLLEVTSSDSH